MRPKIIRVATVAILVLVLLETAATVGQVFAHVAESLKLLVGTNRDKTGTFDERAEGAGPQVQAISVLASRGNLRAECKGFEPSTGFPAPDFKSSRAFQVRFLAFLLGQLDVHCTRLVGRLMRVRIEGRVCQQVRTVVVHGDEHLARLNDRA